MLRATLRASAWRATAHLYYSGSTHVPKYLQVRRDFDKLDFIPGPAAHVLIYCIIKVRTTQTVFASFSFPYLDETLRYILWTSEHMEGLG